ncbi:MAG: DUF2911 domain-containing protein [Bacteroidetes bacterium]|nr:DUF2911 domain-containing protein [Bacteroidota bacterium]
MNGRYLFAIALTISSLCFIRTTNAQYGTGAVHLPFESQGARVGQRIGLTDIDITYHRPAVKGRPIWGGLVPYNGGKPFPWRGGANENTTISFSTDVMIDGKPLAAGTYGLHFIPSASDWTVIFSKNYTSWGSFSYDPAEDALRVSVKPHEAPFEEYLTYLFAEPKPTSVLARLHWEKLAVDIPISIDLGKTVLASINNELRNTPGFTWQGYNSAASFCAKNNIELQQGLEWAENSVQIEARFENLETKSRLLRLLGKQSEADETLQKALSKASVMQVNAYGRGLIAEGKPKEAMAVFQDNAKKHPDEWIVYAGLARGYEGLGDLEHAIEQMKIAQSKAPDANKASIGGTISQWEGMLKKK